MKLEIVTKHVLNDQHVREFTEEKIGFALDRIGDHIRSVTVRLEDEKGKNKAVFDGVCRIEVDLEPRGHVHVSAHGESSFDCVHQAIRKMEHAVKHDIDRHQKASRIRHQQTKRNVNKNLELAADADSIDDR